jgi:hypothetical protein
MNDYMTCRKLCTLYKRRAEHLANSARSAHWADVAQEEIDAILNPSEDPRVRKVRKQLDEVKEYHTRERLRRERERLERKLDASGVASTPTL